MPRQCQRQLGAQRAAGLEDVSLDRDALLGPSGFTAGMVLIGTLDLRW